MNERESDATIEILGNFLINQSIVPITAWFHKNGLTPTVFDKEVLLEQTKADAYNMRVLITMQPEGSGQITTVMLLGVLNKKKEKITLPEESFLISLPFWWSIV